MLSPGWMKILRDIWAARGRMLMMTAAISVSLFGVGVISGSYSILTREISKNYLNTMPAAATLHLENPDEKLEPFVRSQPGVAECETRTSILSRIEVRPGVWMPLLLFVIKDFNSMKLSKFWPESGAWPPLPKTLLLERTALSLYKSSIGQSFTLKTPNGSARSISISGTVHDPSLAPAWQERMGYGYITPETLKWLGETGVLDELKITLGPDSKTSGQVTEKILSLAKTLQDKGYRVHEVQIPPIGKHPHQNQMTALLTLLLVFCFLSLILSAILTAAMISAMMAKETRQIGVMKTIGASTRQITVIYLTLVFFICVAGLAIALPSGLIAAGYLSTVVSTLLNFTLYSQAVTGWVVLSQILAGLMVPLSLTFIPILIASRMSIREAISSVGVNEGKLSTSQSTFLPRLLKDMDRSFLMAIRNTFRRRGRLILTLVLMTFAGAIFLTTINVQAGWDRMIQKSFQNRKYDFEIRLARLESSRQMIDLLSGLPGVKTVEPWGYASVSRRQNDGFEIAHTYPDGGHGSLTLKGVPPQSRLVQFPLLEGRWLSPTHSNEVVLNQSAWALLLKPAVNSEISFTVNDKQRIWRIAGVVQEVGPASIYVNEKDFEREAALPGYAKSLRIVLADKSMESRIQAINTVEQKLAEAGMGVSMVISDAEFRNAITDHIFILIFSLIALSVIMAVVGFLGLTSAVSSNIVERTREYGVMRAIGGTPGNILRNILGETIFTALISIISAMALSLPLSLLIGSMLGDMAFKTPLPLVFSFKGLIVWMVLILAGSILSGSWPAWRASKLTIRETLVYE